MLSALGAGRPGMVALLLGVSAWVLFLAHEPLLVLLGRRGERLRTEQRSRARVRLATLALAGAALGLAALVLAPPDVRAAVVLPVILGAAFAVTLAMGQERSLIGEALAAFALSAVSFPLGIAAGLTLGESARVWCVWALGFGALLIPVRSIGVRRRAGTSLVARLLPVLVAFAIAVDAVRVGTNQGFGLGHLVALAPLVLVAGWLAVWPPPPRNLPRVGWTVVGAGVITTAALVFVVRTGRW
jgi:YwiC-like protein